MATSAVRQNLRADPPLHRCADRALADLRHLSQATRLDNLSGATLLMERAQLAGLSFASGRSAAGTCRLLPARDLTLAVQLARPWDWDCLSAWLELDAQDWTWAKLRTEVRTRDPFVLLERARVLGMAVAAAGAPVPQGAAQQTLEGQQAAGARHGGRPVVLDLSALWAGPLCGHLLWLCGAEVIKVESPNRPDGARNGNPAFYDLLNQGKRCVALDLTCTEGRRRLDALIAHADIVIEASRPRALRQLGVDAEARVRAQRDLTWISISGYGREAPEASWIAFGDDAGVAAGLADIMRGATGRYEFAGDAIADPLTGINAALTAWRSWQQGGSRLISLSLVGVAAQCLADELTECGAAEVTRAFGAWWAQARHARVPQEVTVRPVGAPVSALGEDTAAVLTQFQIPC